MSGLDYMTALFGTACSGWTLWPRYEQRSLIVGLRHRQLFVHNLPVSATVPYMLQRNFGFKTKLDIVWTSDFSPSYHVWAAELGTTRVFTHACIWASRTGIVAAVSKYGEHAWDYVIISWRHNLGATFLYFMFAKCSMFHERWRLRHFQNL